VRALLDAGAAAEVWETTGGHTPMGMAVRVPPSLRYLRATRTANRVGVGVTETTGGHTPMGMTVRVPPSLRYLRATRTANRVGVGVTETTGGHTPMGMTVRVPPSLRYLRATRTANRTNREASGRAHAHAAVSWHPPNPSALVVARTEGCTYLYAARVWAVSLDQGPFSVAPCQTHIVRLANFHTAPLSRVER
jgi:hypothetical protein